MKFIKRSLANKIPCGDCSWCYIGETGRAFDTNVYKIKKHKMFIKFLVVTVHGVILVRLAGPSTQMFIK